MSSSLFLSVKEPQDDSITERVAKSNERIKGNTFLRRRGRISSERKKLDATVLIGTGSSREDFRNL